MALDTQATAPAAMAGLPLHKTVLDGSLEFHHVEEGSGPPLVFIHGGSGDYGTWSAQWEAFTPQYRAISYSRRFSRPNQNPLSTSPNHSALVDADDLAQLLDRWQATPAILVGSSYGAFTALALALRRPELVRAMVLGEPPLMRWADMTPGGRALREQFEREVRAPAREAFLRDDDLAGATALAAGILGQQRLSTLSPEAHGRRFGNLLAMKALTLSDDEFPMLDPDAVRALRIPMLLVSGQETQPIHAAIFSSLCSVATGAEVHRVANSGHSVYREQPQVFNQLVLDFLARLPD